MVQVAVLGARGYLGRCAVALLSQHPEVDAIRCGSSQSGRLGDDIPGLAPLDLELFPAADATAGADVVFNATHEPPPDHAGLVIDLGRTHRLTGIRGGAWTYGLTEAVRAELRGARRVANPGCYPTAAVLPMLPLLEAGLVGSGPIQVTGVSGVSGAGAAPRPDLHYPEMHDTVRAYTVEGHDHETEMDAMLGGFGHNGPVLFVPRLAPMNRGIHAVVTAAAAPGTSAEEARAALTKAWTGEPFLRLVEEPSTAHTRGTNCLVAQVTVRHGVLLVRSALDNLIKGGAGQAVQNMNVALGFDETAGLPRAGVGV